MRPDINTFCDAHKINIYLDESNEVINDIFLLCTNILILGTLAFSWRLGIILVWLPGGQLEYTTWDRSYVSGLDSEHQGEWFTGAHQ